MNRERTPPIATTPTYVDLDRHLARARALRAQATAALLTSVGHRLHAAARRGWRRVTGVATGPSARGPGTAAIGRGAS